MPGFIWSGIRIDRTKQIHKKGRCEKPVPKINMKPFTKKIVLENGREFYGYGFGADREVINEIVFNTSMVGYQEIMSDPSYTDQMVVMTYPLIGNYGMADEDYETKTPTIGGMIVREYNDSPSNFRYTKTLNEVFEEHDIPAIWGVDTRALMRVHTSNYRVIGFHADVALEDMARLAHEHGLPLLEDLGSGSLLDFSPWGLPGEPTARQVIEAGADVVTFSGDKVLGGPQAGIIAGREEFIEAMRHNQLLRALRCDKMTLAALEATLRLYLDPHKAIASVPTLRRMTMSAAELKRRAEKLQRALRRALPAGLAELSLLTGVSRVGGGAFPECDLPTTLVRVLPLARTVEDTRARLLRTEPPLVTRVENGALLLDPRTLEDHEFPTLVRVLNSALDGVKS